MNIHEQEKILWNEWCDSYPVDEQVNFVMDGLCYNGELYNDNWNSYPGNEEELWNESKRKIVFLMKDSNGNPGEDYRMWPWRAVTAKFFKVILYWLQGLSEITSKHTPLLGDNSYLDPVNQVILKYPLAIVNIKKISGSSSVHNDVLYNYAERDAFFLRKQVRDILRPNIIVCGGGSDSLLNITMRCIYPELKFEKINNWCYYSEERELLLINSWHPSYMISDVEKIDSMMHAVADFISIKQPEIFK
jgi:hypothetical protein bfra3_18342